MIKICFITIGVGIGGDKTRIYFLLKHLDRSKFNITLVCDTKGERSKLFEFSDVKVRRFPISSPYNIRGIYYLYKLFRKEKFNIIQIFNIKMHILGTLAAFFAGISERICFILENTKACFLAKKRSILYSGVYFILLRLSYLIATRLMTNTHANKKDNKWLTGRKQVDVVYSGYEIPTEIIPINIELPKHFSKLPIIVYNGRIDEEKGLHVLVEAIKILNCKYGKEVGVLVLGKSLRHKYFKRMKELVISYNLEESFWFAGFVTNVHEWILKAQILVLPSLAESMGYSIFDAWSCKIPVIASRVGGIPEIVDDGVNGVLFDPGNAFDLANKLLYLINDHEIAKRMGRKGYKTLMERFNMEQHIQMMEQLYFSIMKESKSNRIIGGN